MIPQRIGHYKIVGVLGAGGIGQVYEAIDEDLDRTVALKGLRREYSEDANFIERFRAEATSLARLAHPNITTLYSLHRDGREVCMVMELVRGATLEVVLERLKRLEVRECLAVTDQIIAGLAYAHQMGVVHRDIKPSNAMITGSGVLKLMDFGIARVRGSKRLTREGSLIGTLSYLAPELAKGGEGDERSDLYSLACVVYELISGYPPFVSDSEYALIRAHVEQPPVLLSEKLPGLDAGFVEAVNRALAKDPDQRFASAAEFGQALGTAAVHAESVNAVREIWNNTARLAPSVATRVVSINQGAAAVEAAPAAAPVQFADLIRLDDIKRFIKTASQRFKSQLRPTVVLGAAGAVCLITLIFVGYGLFHPPGGTSQTSPAPVTNRVAQVGSRLAFLPPPDAGNKNRQSSGIFGAPRTLPVNAPLGGSEVRGSVTNFSSSGWPLITERVVRIHGIYPIAEAAGQKRVLDWIGHNGGTVRCQAVTSETYRCFATAGGGANGTDLAVAALQLGASRVAGDIAAGPNFPADVLSQYRAASAQGGAQAGRESRGTAAGLRGSQLTTGSMSRRGSRPASSAADAADDVGQAQPSSRAQSGGMVRCYLPGKTIVQLSHARCRQSMGLVLPAQ